MSGEKLKSSLKSSMIELLVNGFASLSNLAAYSVKLVSRTGSLSAVVARFTLTYITGANCIGIGINDQLTSANTGAWETLTAQVNADPLPNGVPTASVRIAAFVETAFDGNQITARFDKLFFGPDGTTPVTLQSFGVE